MSKNIFFLNYIVDNRTRVPIFTNTETGVSKILTRSKCHVELYFDKDGNFVVDLYDGDKKVVHKHKK